MDEAARSIKRSVALGTSIEGLCRSGRVRTSVTNIFRGYDLRVAALAESLSTVQQLGANFRVY